MKKNKLIGIVVASAGILLSVGGAAALYTRAASPTGFGIGAGTYQGSKGVVTYKINGNTSGNVAPKYWNTSGNDHTGTGLGGDFTQVVYEFNLSATYAAEGTHAQTVTAGNFAVSLTSVPEAYRDHLSIWVGVDGYTKNTVGAEYAEVFMNSDYNITTEHPSYEDNKDIAVKSAGGQTVRVYLKFDSTIANGDGLYAKDQAGLGYTLSVTWGAVSASFESAYVVGDGNQWTDDDEFIMVPDIDNATWRWRFDNCPGTLLKAKCHKGSIWSNGSDYELDASKSYNVLWDGDASSAATFTQI